MPFTTPLRRERQTPRSRSRSNTPSNLIPVSTPPIATFPVSSVHSSSSERANHGPRPALSSASGSGNLNGPQRNISTSSSASGTTTTSASSTSSLEAVPIKPAAGTRLDVRQLTMSLVGAETSPVEERGGSGARNGDGRDGMGGQALPRSGTNGKANPSSNFVVLSRNSSHNHDDDLHASELRLDAQQRNGTLMPPSSPPNRMDNTIRSRQPPTMPGAWTSSPSSTTTGLTSAAPPPLEQVDRNWTPPSPSPDVVELSEADMAHRPRNDEYWIHQPQPRRLSQATARQSLYGASPPPNPPSPFHGNFPHSTSSATIYSAPTQQQQPQRPLSAMHQIFLPAELRTSSSGPDLASLQRDREREKRERARRSEHEAQGDEADAEAEEDPRAGIRAGARPKVRTRSSGAQITQMEKVLSASPSGGSIPEGGTDPGSGGYVISQPRLEPRKAVTLEDFSIGSVLGRGSYSIVVLASQNATNVPYAIKILDQQQLLQEKKTKYAKVERDALIRLGPRAVPIVNGMPVGKQRNGDRRGSTASAGTSRSGGKTRREMTEPGKRRGPSASAGPSQVQLGPEITFDKDSGIAIVRERRSAEIRRESFSDAGRALARDEREDRSEPLHRGVIVGSREAQAVSKNSAAGELGNGKSTHSYSISSKNTIPTSTPANATLSRSGLMVQTSNLSNPRSDESALALSPDSVVSNFSVAGRSRDPSQNGSVRPSGRRKRASHPGVVRLHYTFKDHVSLYFVLDLAIHGELLGLIKKHGSLDIDSARAYAAQIIDTVDFMHERGVIHRDLKPENILLDDDMRIKITDFGSAKVCDPETMMPVDVPEEGSKRSFVGTAEYVSPEVLRNDPATTASDVWAFGCVLFQMIAGRPPFRGATEYLTFQQVLKADYQLPDGFDAQAKELVDSIFHVEPTLRPTVESIKSHPFFSSPTPPPSGSIRPTDFATIWTDLMPPILPGLVPPPPTENKRLDLTRHGWSDFLGHSGTSGSEETHGGPIVDEPEEDDGIDSAEEEEMMRRPTRMVLQAGEGDPLVQYPADTGGRATPIRFPTADNDVEEEPDLAAPSRRWFQRRGSPAPEAESGSASPVGTTGSRNGTDDDVSLVGGGSTSERRRGSSAKGSVADSWIGATIKGGVNGARRPSDSGTYVGATIKEGGVQATPTPPGREVEVAPESAWANILLPNERITYSSPILYRSHASLFLPKRRTLVLTTLPRLICVKEDNSNPTNGGKTNGKSRNGGNIKAGPGSAGLGGSRSGIKIKAECLFGRAALDLMQHVRQSSPGVWIKESQDVGKVKGKDNEEARQAERIRRTVGKVSEKGPRAFIIQTPEKDHTFLADRGDIRARWMVEIMRVKDM